MKLLYDLLIATNKDGYNSITSDREPIKWLKQAGFPHRSPKIKGTSIVSPQVQNFLLGYKLVDTEVQEFQVIMKYKKVDHKKRLAHNVELMRPEKGYID